MVVMRGLDPRICAPGGDCPADLRTRIFLDEMASLDGDFGLMEPFATEFALSSYEDRARSGIDEQLWDIVLRHPVGIGAHQPYDRRRRPIDRDLAGPGERRPPVLARLGKGAPILLHLARLQLAQD